MTNPISEKWTPVPGFDFKDIIYEKKDFWNGGLAARITINRPDRYNSITNVGMQEINDALSDSNHDHFVGVVVLTGAGDKAFCTGGDVGWEEKGGSRRQFEQPVSINKAIHMCLKPIIAAIKGYAIGGGNHWAYHCDLAIAAENAIFGQVGPRVGSPADGFLVAYLTRVVGARKAKEMWMLCRRYNAQQALEMGLVNTVVPLDKFDEEVDKWCREILALDPTCLRIVKESFNVDTDYMVHSMYSTVHIVAPDFIDSDEQKEGFRAFAEKRKPNFWKFIK